MRSRPCGWPQTFQKDERRGTEEDNRSAAGKEEDPGRQTVTRCWGQHAIMGTNGMVDTIVERLGT